jgi:hypothetical protein
LACASGIILGAERGSALAMPWSRKAAAVAADASRNARRLRMVDEHRATLIAQSRLNQALNQLRSEGLDARGDIGDPEPLTAIEDALAGQQFDEIIISILPSGISHWLRMDLPQRAERKFKLPVTTITTRH